FSINYRHSADASYLDAARRCADYYLAHLPGDCVPLWDLAFGASNGQPRDSSAAAIAACGLLELSHHMDGLGQSGSTYRDAAEATVASLASGYAPNHVAPGAPLLLHGVYDLPAGNGVDEGNLWGDYFYLEALLRLSNPQWTPWW
ncbi:MAG: hypothetical protein FWD80_05495, partial [Propionibacteriaceae bacterium]|nr:hypothetical protein [Propionibacteriaceae bacterium]